MVLLKEMSYFLNKISNVEITFLHYAGSPLCMSEKILSI